MTYEDYLIHSSECYHAVYGPQPRNRRRSSNFKPKFIAKVGNRYFYSQAEYEAFKRGGRRNSSRSLYAQSVQKQRKNAKMYGPVQKTGKQNTSLKKEVQKAIQKSRPAMVRLRDAFNKTISEIKKSAVDVINRGKQFISEALGRLNLARSQREIESKYNKKQIEIGNHDMAIRDLEMRGHNNREMRRSRDDEDREIALRTSRRRELYNQMDDLADEYDRNNETLDPRGRLRQITTDKLPKNERDLKKKKEELEELKEDLDREKNRTSKDEYAIKRLEERIRYKENNLSKLKKENEKLNSDAKRIRDRYGWLPA